MSGKNINFEERKLKEATFTKTKKHFKSIALMLIFLVSKEESYGSQNSFKYFIGYNDNDVIRPLCVKLPQVTDYAKKFEFNSTMSFKISDKQLFRKYNQIWKKAEKLLKIKFNSKHVYGDGEKYIKTKIKTQ